MKKILLAFTILIASITANAQSWGNFNSFGLQRKIVSGDTTWRFVGSGSNGFLSFNPSGGGGTADSTVFRTKNNSYSLAGMQTKLNNYVLGTRSVTGGFGMLGGGNLTADRVIYADTTVLRSWSNSLSLSQLQTKFNLYTLQTRTLTGGNGINTIGDLSSNRTISADTSILATKANTKTLAQLQTAFNLKQNSLTLTTTGTSGAATLVGSTLNIPNYASGGGSGTVTSITPGTGFTSSTPITTSGTLNVDVGTGNSKIVQRDGGSGIPISAFTDDRIITGGQGIINYSAGSATFGVHNFLVNSGNNAFKISTDKSLTASLYASGNTTPTPTGTEHMLTVDANGLFGHRTIPSGSSGWGLTGNSGTTTGTNFVGTTDSQPLMFKVNGVRSGYLSTSNTSFGYNSLSSGSLSGTENNAIGVASLPAVTSGSYNNAMGYGASLNITTGSENTSMGRLALQNNITSDGNTAVGSQSLASATGANNTALGNQSGSNVSSGIRNTAIGYATAFASGSADYQLNLANGLFGTGLSGSIGSPVGKIGVMTSAPNHTFDVAGNIGFSGYLNASSTDGSSGYGFRDNAGSMEYKNSGGSWTAIPGSSFWSRLGTNQIQPAKTDDAIFLSSVAVALQATSSGSSQPAASFNSSGGDGITVATSASGSYGINVSNSGGGDLALFKGSSGATRATLKQNGTLLLKGGIAYGYVSVTSTYSATVDDRTINCTSGTFTVTLSTSVAVGQEVVVKNRGAGIITVGGTIDGNTNDSIVAGASGTYVWTGSEYIKV